MKMKRLEPVVMDVMERYELTRSDDFLLIYYVFVELNNTIKDKPLYDVMLNHKAYGLPSMHSVTRVRRKLFEKYPNIKPKKVTKARKQKQEEFVEYATS